MSERKTSGCGCALIGTAIILGLLGCVVATLLFLRYRAAGDVEERLAEIRARGEPASGAELNAYYDQRVNDDETTQAWLTVLQAIADREIPKKAPHLPVLGDDDAPIPMAGTEWPARQATQSFLDEHSDLIDQLHAAASHSSGVRYPLDLSVGIENLSLEHLGHIRTASRLLLLDAHAHAHGDDVEGALRSVDAMLATSDVLREEPLINSHFVRIATGTMAVQTLAKVLPLADDVSDQQLAEIQGRLRNRDLPASFNQALIGERALSSDAFKNLGGDAATNRPRFPVVRYGDLLYYLTTTEQMIDASSEQPWPKAYQAGRQIDKRIRQELANATFLKKSNRMLTYMTVPAMTKAFEATSRGIAIDRIGETSVAIRRYANSRSELPPTLTALVPEFMPAVPVDPFDGKPLRYFAQDDVIVVYSIGRDETDDGGVSEDESFEPDIAVTMQMSETKRSGEAQ